MSDVFSHLNLLRGITTPLHDYSSRRMPQILPRYKDRWNLPSLVFILSRKAYWSLTKTCTSCTNLTLLVLNVLTCTNYL